MTNNVRVDTLPTITNTRAVKRCETVRTAFGFAENASKTTLSSTGDPTEYLRHDVRFVEVRWDVTGLDNGTFLKIVQEA